MHVAQLGGSHYAQYLGMSAGVAALILSCQPLLTAFFASRFLGERLKPGQWLGVFVGLAGVALVVWHKLDIREVRLGSLLGSLIALASVTLATLYQRRFAPQADLKAAAVIQFADRGCRGGAAGASPSKGSSSRAPGCYGARSPSW